MQYQKSFVLDLSLFIRVAKISTIFVFFDEWDWNFNTTELIKRIHDSVDLLRRSTCINSFHFILKIIFDNEILHAYNWFSDLSLQDLLRQEGLCCFVWSVLQFFYPTDLFFYFSIHEGGVLTLRFHSYWGWLNDRCNILHFFHRIFHIFYVLHLLTRLSFGYILPQ